MAVPSAADSWTNLNNFTVPAGVKRIKKIRLGTAPDWGTTAGSVRAAPVYRLTGSGLLEQSPHFLIGQFGAHAEVTTGGIQQNMLDMEYDVDIPVSTGGQIVVDVNTLDEAITAGSLEFNLFYDEQAPTLKNSMSDYVEAPTPTAADAWTTVGTFTVPQPSQASAPKQIRAIVLAVAVDQGTSAVSLRLAPRFRISGSGVAEGGNHEYLGPTQFSGEIGTTPSQGIAQDHGTRMIVVSVPVNPGGQILAETKFDTEIPTDGTVAVGLLYGA